MKILLSLVLATFLAGLGGCENMRVALGGLSVNSSGLLNGGKVNTSYTF